MSVYAAALCAGWTVQHGSSAACRVWEHASEVKLPPMSRAGLIV
jgi:hypothetical protein